LPTHPAPLTLLYLLKDHARLPQRAQDDFEGVVERLQILDGFDQSRVRPKLAKILDARAALPVTDPAIYVSMTPGGAIGPFLALVGSGNLGDATAEVASRSLLLSGRLAEVFGGINKVTPTAFICDLTGLQNMMSFRNKEVLQGRYGLDWVAKHKLTFTIRHAGEKLEVPFAKFTDEASRPGAPPDSKRSAKCVMSWMGSALGLGPAVGFLALGASAREGPHVCLLCDS